MKKPIIKPGERAEFSGIYDLMNARGKSTGIQRAIGENEKAPPTPHKHQSFRLAVKTKTNG